MEPPIDGADDEAAEEEEEPPSQKETCPHPTCN